MDADPGADADGLAAQLDLTINAGTCTSPGAQLYTGSLAGAALTDRVVDAGADADLCFTWELPFGTGNAFQGADAAVVFTFDAEQTANNP
jgi:hypothetical protein